MFNFFKKQSDEQTKEVSTKEYPKAVQEIHKEFMTAGDKILAEAKRIIADGKSKQIEKANRLLELGFRSVPEVSAAHRLSLTTETAELIEYYLVNYPNCKFITEEQVAEICEKYSLHCGDISLYKGFVPEKNLLEIESFKIKDEDKNIVELINTCVVNVSLGWYNEKDLCASEYIIASGVIDGRSKLQSQILTKALQLNVPQHCVFVQRRRRNIPLQICAPIKDMDTSGLKIGKYKIEQHYPDPVVLHPVNGGYLILTAWGDEASDENVVNQKMN